MKTVYHFRTIKATDERAATLLAAAQAGKCKVEEIKEGEGEAAKLVGYCRESVELEIPSIPASSFSPEFIQGLLDDLTSNYVKKTFVDEFLPLGEITAEKLIAFAVGERKQRAEKISPEIYELANTTFAAILQARQVAADTAGVILALCKGKFSAKILGKYSAIQKQIPAILTGLVGYVNALAKLDEAGNPVNAGNADIAAKIRPVVDAYQHNYSQWLAGCLTSAETLDFGAM